MNSPGPGPMALWIRGSHYPGYLGWLRSPARFTGGFGGWIPVLKAPINTPSLSCNAHPIWIGCGDSFPFLGQIHSLRLCGLTRTVSHWIQICEIHSLLALIEISFFWLLVSNIWIPFPSYMGCHPNLIDELHHFSRWWNCTTNQFLTQNDQQNGLDLERVPKRYRYR